MGLPEGRNDTWALRSCLRLRGALRPTPDVYDTKAHPKANGALDLRRDQASVRYATWGLLVDNFVVAKPAQVLDKALDRRLSHRG